MLGFRGAGRERARCEPGEQAVAPNAELAVDGHQAVVVVVRGELADALTVGDQAADKRAIGQLALHPRHREVVGRDAGRAHLLRLHVQEADLHAGQVARHARPGDDRHRLAVRPDADPAAEEQLHLAGLPHGEEAGVLEEERPLLRKEQVEAVEVDLLLVHLHLGEVGVVGRIERQARRDAVLEVRAEVRVRAGGLISVRYHVARPFDERVRRELQIARRGKFEPFEGAGE